ncbi:hypothetical protein E1757_07085 [Paenibacillus piri]|uniref:Uncharacterized protein n=2 Tax=Paenibacillus piri TaxID=2547395 RepID=A0A4R5KXP2_9BACL|nr:hypothetical protein E1757_07085 [Paenibacillus piri]
MLIIVPVFLLCAMLIDFSRLKVAEKEAENAVKTGVRSTLSAFSRQLQAYGLYALRQDGEEERTQTKELFQHTVSENMSGSVAKGGFQLVDQRLEKDRSSITPMYTLANHTIMKKQILEEMKYRAPMIFALELADKFKKTGLASTLGQASRFSKNAVQIEGLLEERDRRLDQAWAAWSSIYNKAAAAHPFYQTQLSDLNELSGKVGIHTVDEVKQSLQSAKRDLDDLQSQVRKIDRNIRSLIEAGAGISAAAERLRETRAELKSQIADIGDKISDLNQLLEDVQKYVALLAMLKLKSSADLAEFKAMLKSFEDALAGAKSANDQLNDQLRSITAQQQSSSTSAMEAERAFEGIYMISRQELDEYGSQAAASIASFAGLEAQLGNVLLFDAGNYRNADQTLQSFWKLAQELFTRQGAKEAERNKNKAAVTTSKREQRNKAQPYLDQVTKAMGSCSLTGLTDPFKASYVTLQGDPSKGSTGLYQAYMSVNRQTDLAQPVPDIKLDDADKAGMSAMNLVSSIESVLADVRDEFYLDEFAVSKFNYRTFGLEKDMNGQVKVSNELSRPDSHALVNQELEYLLYGANSCLGNYSAAYAEMFVIRLAVGTAEALTEPHIQSLNLGSPLLVFLAAVAEGAVKAQMDMMKLVQGEAVPLSKKFGSAFSLTYKDYLRLFFLLHSRDKVLLSRMQALIELNTGVPLTQSTTYLSGTATTSVKLWFMPGVMKWVGASELYSCRVIGTRCYITKTGAMSY